MPETAVSRSQDPPAGAVIACVASSACGPEVLSTAWDLATRSDAPLIAAFFEPAGDTPEPGFMERLSRARRLAAKVGARVVSLPGRDPAEELQDLIRRQGASRIVIGTAPVPAAGKPPGAPWVDRLVAANDGLEVQVVRVADEAPSPTPVRPWPLPLGLGPAAGTALLLGIATAVGELIYRDAFHDSIVVLIYLTAVAIVSAWYGRGAGAVASVAGVVLFDFVFVEPRFGFVPHNPDYKFTLSVTLVTALTVSGLTAWIRGQAEAARSRERLMSGLYLLIRQAASAPDRARLIEALVATVAELLEARSTLWLPGPDGALLASTAPDRDQAFRAEEAGAARWTFDHPEGVDPSNAWVQGFCGTCVPVTGTSGVVGVLTVAAEPDGGPMDPERRMLVQAMANQIALSLEREAAKTEAQRRILDARSEVIRSAFLSAVSHDLRTPLATIAGASETLMQPGDALDEDARNALLGSIREEAARVCDQVENVLAMTRMDAGEVELNLDWQPIEGVVGSALRRMDRPLRGRTTTVSIPADLPVVPIDGALVERLLVNLLDNARKYSPEGTPITIEGRSQGGEVVVSVIDQGPGVPPGERERIFEKFVRLPRPDTGPRVPGSGLGLAICRAIVLAHGGRIWVDPAPGGGSAFRFGLPIAPKPPEPGRGS